MGHLQITRRTQENTNYVKAMKIADPKQRLLEVYKLCHGKKTCSGGERMDESAMTNTFHELDSAPADHSTGCGASQPKVRRDGVLAFSFSFLSSAWAQCR